MGAGNDISLNNIIYTIIPILWTTPEYSLPVLGGSIVKGVAAVSVDLLGGEYILFTLDDYTKNYATNGLIGIGVQNTKLAIPSYGGKIIHDASASICDTNTNRVSQYVPTFPRKLTQSQIYSLNEITNNRQKSSLIVSSPNPSDLFATIDINSNNGSINWIGSAENKFKRSYFGPITLERIGIKLIDSLGNLVNLHGHNWSFTLEVEQLYQY